MVVAIDGPAGVGKSTIASCAAKRTKFLWVNSGSFYRLITRTTLGTGKNPQKEEDVIEAAAGCHFEMRGDNLYLNGKQAAEDIYSDLIDKWVAFHSSILRVREMVNQQLKALAEKRNLIVEGRDIGTVVFPDAEVKIFLDASLETRSLRRFRQGVSNLSEEKIMGRLKERDYVDSHKPVGRLERAAGAQYIDTSDLTIKQVCEKVVAEILKKGKTNRE
ncbi:Cytidylate kinase [subsurface metagenome]